MIDLPISFAKRAHALHAEQRDEEAMRLVNAALALEPTLTCALYLKGIIALSQGDFAGGLPLYELRDQQLNAERFGYGRYRHVPVWDGSPTHKRVLLWAEQGFGDTLMALRYVPYVRRHCPNLIVEVQPELVRLVEAQRWGVTVYPVESKGRGCDLALRMMSLPIVSGTRLGNLPSKTYLDPRGATLPQDGPRWGLCWQSQSSHVAEELQSRDVPIDALEPLNGFDWLCLHREHLGGGDWLDTARLVAGLDLVVTSDTAIAHLAGALGVETWLMLSTQCDWRWLQHRADSPWYPTMRLFRQKTLGEWGPVIDEVAAALHRRVCAPVLSAA